MSDLAEAIHGQMASPLGQNIGDTDRFRVTKTTFNGERIMAPNGKPKFLLGQVLATPGALEALQESGQAPDFFLQKHQSGDWGEICDEDKMLNDQALVDGSRLLSAYRTLTGERLWIITEAADDSGHRVASTILKPSEY